MNIQIVTAVIGVCGSLLSVCLKNYLDRPPRRLADSEPSVSAGEPIAISPPSPIAPPKSATQRREPFATAAFVFCLLSIIIPFFGFLLSIIFGHLALARIRRDPTLGGYRLAKGSLIASYICLVLTLVIYVLAHK